MISTDADCMYVYTRTCWKLHLHTRRYELRDSQQIDLRLIGVNKLFNVKR